MLKITGICITNQNAEGSDRQYLGYGSRDLRVKVKFDQFGRFVFGFLPLPLAYGILRRLYQERISTYDLDGFNSAVGQNQGFQLYSAAQGQWARHGRITWHDAIGNLARGLRWFRRVTLCRK
jgi:hypothetical protein